MKNKLFVGILGIIVVSIAIVFLYPRYFPSPQERKVLYWTDAMIPGDRSDHPGKSPMGMERTPVYEDQTTGSTKTSFTAEEIYQCPMHPQVTSNKRGVCSICGMTLVKRAVEKSGSDTHTARSFSVSPGKQMLANVSTAAAKKISLKKTIRAVGTIAYTEPSYRHISSRFPGRIDKLYLSYTGQHVKQGDPVADIYSPEAISAQQEYLLAKDSYAQVKDSPAIVSGGALALFDQSLNKLKLWGFTEEQIAWLDSTNSVQTSVTIYSPISGTILKKNVDQQQYTSVGEDLYDVADLSTVWLYIDIYEFEIPSVKIGDSVEAMSDTNPGESFRGKINFISPTIDPSSRTIRLRADISNHEEKLRPEMFVNVALNIRFPATVVVPLSAILSTGTSHVVWIQKEPEIFESRPVKIGARNEQDVQILDGINMGEVVVTSGGYLIDSESQLVSMSKETDDHK
jgi:Cu(I)/Ag(I) efflux system membrane fusion protein